jgi:hypothetical protein
LCPRMVRGGLKSRKFFRGPHGPSTAVGRIRQIGSTPIQNLYNFYMCHNDTPMPMSSLGYRHNIRPPIREAVWLLFDEQRQYHDDCQNYMFHATNSRLFPAPLPETEYSIHSRMRNRLTSLVFASGPDYLHKLETPIARLRTLSLV